MHPNSAHFNEFTIVLPGPAAAALHYLDRRGITAGLDLGSIDIKLSNNLLITATDQNSVADAEALAAGLETWIASLSKPSQEVGR
jgi:hypothetical protein